MLNSSYSLQADNIHAWVEGPQRGEVETDRVDLRPNASSSYSFAISTDPTCYVDGCFVWSSGRILAKTWSIPTVTCNSTVSISCKMKSTQKLIMINIYNVTHASIANVPSLSETTLLASTTYTVYNNSKLDPSTMLSSMVPETSISISISISISTSIISTTNSTEVTEISGGTI